MIHAARIRTMHTCRRQSWGWGRRPQTLGRGLWAGREILYSVYTRSMFEGGDFSREFAQNIAVNGNFVWIKKLGVTKKSRKIELFWKFARKNRNFSRNLPGKV